MLADQELIRRAQGGDEAAFTDIVAACRRRVLGTVLRMIGRPEDAEDIAQEVFVRLYFSLDQLRSPDMFDAWLYRLTVNAVYDYLRRFRRRPESRMCDLAEEQVVLADAEASGRACVEAEYHNDVRSFMDHLLNALSDDDRVLLTLKEIEGLSLRELESIYGINENAIKVRLFRARQRALRAFERLQTKLPARPRAVARAAGA